jgi:hypothetical protein
MELELAFFKHFEQSNIGATGATHGGFPQQLFFNKPFLCSIPSHGARIGLSYTFLKHLSI